MTREKHRHFRSYTHPNCPAVRLYVYTIERCGTTCETQTAGGICVNYLRRSEAAKLLNHWRQIGR